MRVVIGLVLLSKLIFILSLNILNTGHSNGHTFLCEIRHSLIRVIQRMSVLFHSSCCIYAASYDILSLSFYRKKSEYPSSEISKINRISF